MVSYAVTEALVFIEFNKNLSISPVKTLKEFAEWLSCYYTRYGFIGNGRGEFNFGKSILRGATSSLLIKCSLRGHVGKKKLLQVLTLKPL